VALLKASADGPAGALTGRARRAFAVLREWQEPAAARALLFRLLLLLYAEGRGLLPAGASDRGGGLRAAFERLPRAEPGFRLWPFSTSSAEPASCAGVPDWALARALGELTGDGNEPGEPPALEYRALPVRHLGSVYEGLLDPTGRKRTGAFYTPAPVVEYIVRHTLGPVLAGKLRSPGRGRADWLERGFDLRVLDPAMGSGHFLLAAARFIVDRLSRAVADGGGRAADLDLLRRYVWQRCLYGLDVDPCAAALARWSAWLEAGLPGTSPALVAGNLRHGDALLGTALDELGPGPFDAILGNPPYLGVRTGRHHPAFAEHVRRHFHTATKNWDIAGLFLETVLQGRLGRPRLGMVVPLRLATNHDHARLRQLLFAAGGPERVLDCGTVFGGPSVAACVLITPVGVGAAAAGSRRVWVGTWRPPQRPNQRRLPVALLRALPDRPLLSRLGESQLPIFQRLTDSPRRLKDYVCISRGMECGKNDRHVRRRPGAGRVPVISGEGVQPFRVVAQDLFMRLGLVPRSRYKPPELFTRTPKLVLRFVAPYPVAAVDTAGVANFNTVYNAHANLGPPDLLYGLAVLLNSSLLRWWFATAFNGEETVFPHIQKYQLDQIPMPGLAELGTEIIRLGKELTAAGEPRDLTRVDELSCTAFGLKELPPWLPGHYGGLT
jgi:hypothetical protein